MDNLIGIDPELVKYLMIKSGIEDLDEFEQYKINPDIIKSITTECSCKEHNLEKAITKKDLIFKPDLHMGDGKATTE